MKRRVNQIAMLGLLVVFLSVIAAPVLGAPITGKTGDRIQMNFMYRTLTSLMRGSISTQDGRS